MYKIKKKIDFFFTTLILQKETFSICCKTVLNCFKKVRCRM